jgi:hypothetical protein
MPAHGGSLVRTVVGSLLLGAGVVSLGTLTYLVLVPGVNEPAGCRVGQLFPYLLTAALVGGIVGACLGLCIAVDQVESESTVHPTSHPCSPAERQKFMRRPGAPHGRERSRHPDRSHQDPGAAPTGG